MGGAGDIFRILRHGYFRITHHIFTGSHTSLEITTVFSRAKPTPRAGGATGVVQRNWMGGAGHNSLSFRPFNISPTNLTDSHVLATPSAPPCPCGRMISEDWVAQRLLFSGECETNISMGVFPGVSGVSPDPRGGILTTWVTDNIPRYFEHHFIKILLFGPGGPQAFLTGY